MLYYGLSRTLTPASINLFTFRRLEFRRLRGAQWSSFDIPDICIDLKQDRGAPPHTPLLAAWQGVGLKTNPTPTTEHRRSIGVKGFRGINGRLPASGSPPFIPRSLDPASAYLDPLFSKVGSITFLRAALAGALIAALATSRLPTSTT